MAGISRISSITSKIVEKGLKTPIDKLSRTKLAKTMCDDFRSGDPKKYMKWGIYSIVLKDGLGCAMYVWQSLNNKKIPEEKRKFVAALDLTNGGLMIATQLLMAKGMSKISSKLFEKYFGKLFNSSAAQKCAAKIKEQPKFSNLTNKEFNKTFKKFKNQIGSFFEVLTTLVAATIVAKRVIVPFIATPMADKVKGMMDKKSQKQDETKAEAK